MLLFSDGYRDRDRRSPYYDESEPEEPFRIFVALFDYDPLSMSPNPDAADEELPFKEGQIIRVGIAPPCRHKQLFLHFLIFKDCGKNVES